MGRQPRVDVEKYWVYIVRCSDGSLYTGMTSNVKGRVARHNSGKGSKYTRSRLPVRLVYLERVGSRADALRRESAIKRMGRSAKLLLCSRSPAESKQSVR